MSSKNNQDAPPDYNQSEPRWVPPSTQNNHQYPPNPHMQGQPSNWEIARDYQAQLFARCAQGIHEPTTKFGICGIITAVVCFPIGLICLFIDTEQKCSRCGVRL